MSEVFNFKPLSEVDTQEAPTETTTVLAVENGAVKQIPAGKFGGGGAGNFIVNLTAEMVDEAPAITAADKTFAEIIAAAESGSVPFARMSMLGQTLFIPMIAAVNDASEGMAAFAAINPMASGFLAVVCTVDDVWQMNAT